MRKDELTRRLRQAYRVEVDDDTAARQMSLIAAELGTAEPAPAPGRFRRRVTALAAILAVALPGGLAVAAEGTVPGDVLYPVKLVTEQARSLIDPSVPAEHRVQEVEEMLERDVPLERVVDHLRVADRTLSTLPDHEELDRRFDHVVDLVRDRVGPDRIGADRFRHHRRDRFSGTDTPADATNGDTSGDAYDRDVEELDVADDATLDTDTDRLIHDRMTDDGMTDGGMTDGGMTDGGMTDGGGGGMDMPGDGGGMDRPGG